MATAPASEAPAEGPRKDEPDARKGSGEPPRQVEPAEGGDDLPAGTAGSPR